MRREFSKATSERLTVGGGSVIDVWIIVREPNRVPEVKRPGAKGTETAEKMLREMIAHRNQETQFILVELTWNHELWVQDGREYLAMFDEGLEGPVDHFPHQPGPAAGDGARKAAEEILSWAFQNECDRLNGKAFMLADELTKYCASIIARHCPAPDQAAGWNEAIEAAANVADDISWFKAQVFNGPSVETAASIAARIRALKSTNPHPDSGGE